MVRGNVKKVSGRTRERGDGGRKRERKSRRKKGGGPNRTVSEHKGNEAEKNEKTGPKTEGKE